MSQTTRCPACHTRFKVVADQLRISEGWVRCGHCKEVFDAMLSLEPAAPEPLLPEMALDRLRGPVERAPEPLPQARNWGSGAGDPVAASRGLAAPVQPAVSPPEDASDSEDSDDGFAATQIGDLDAEQVAQELAPADHVPAFLRDPAQQPFDDQDDRAGEAAHRGEATSQSQSAPPAAPGRTSSPWQDPWRAAEGLTDGFLRPAPAARPHGYELPAAQPDERDSDWPALFDEVPPAPPASTPPASWDQGDGPEPDLAHFIAEVAEWSTGKSDAPAVQPLSAGSLPRPPWAASAPVTTEPILPASPAPAAGAPLATAGPSAVPLQQPTPSDPQAPADAAGDPDDPDWTLVQEDGPVQQGLAAVDAYTGPSAATVAPEPTALATAPQDLSESERELSFVRQARRRAFWSAASVRAGLLLAVLALLLGLAAQIGLHERARLSAMWPQSRPLWALACEYLHCSVGDYRDMGAVVVEGSSFNRVQGERYQFALTLRNRAALPVEAPAIELTLTDTDDQPVLRRVLKPEDLSVPNPLRPGAEWSTVIPMAITSSGPRIAGYRVLAFYP